MAPKTTTLSILIRFLALFAVLAALLFGSAGRIDIPEFWLYLFLVAAFAIIGARAAGPELLRERIKPGPGGRDHFTRVAAIPLMLGHLMVAGLDVGRYHWSDTVPLALQIAGFGGMVFGMVVWVWAMRTNRFFSSVIRIQSDRGHHVVTGGPYRFVRHPGYAAAIPLYLCSGLALGSWWSMAPAAGMCLLMLRRAVLEDRILQEQLEGYKEYAARVRYRLAPGLW